MTSQAPDTHATTDPHTAQPDALAVGAAGGASAPRSTHRPGNWRSLVISMAVMTTFVLAFVALQPHPVARERTTVDVVRGSSQLARETGWPIATAHLGEDWHPTSMRLAPDDKGVQTWRLGYHQRPGDARYVEILQTKAGEGVTSDVLNAWVTRQTLNAPEAGGSVVGQTTWKRHSARMEGDADRVRRSLVVTGAGAPGGLATVVTGEVDYATLERFAGVLQPSATTPAPTQGSAGSSPAGAPTASTVPKAPAS